MMGLLEDTAIFCGAVILVCVTAVSVYSTISAIKNHNKSNDKGSN